MHLVHLRKLEGGDWPLAIVAFDRNSQAMVKDRIALFDSATRGINDELGCQALGLNWCKLQPPRLKAISAFGD